MIPQDVINYFNAINDKPNLNEIYSIMLKVLPYRVYKHFQEFCDIEYINGKFELIHLENGRASLYEDASEFIY